MMDYRYSHGYESKIEDGRMFKSREAAESFDLDAAQKLLTGLDSEAVRSALDASLHSSNLIQAAIIFAAERIRSLPARADREQAD